MPKTVSVSEKPWSSYTEADYTLEQWHAACLIHQHQGAPTSKQQCKLPVRTPNGTLSRAGVHAAAAALAGARADLKATAEEKAQAARALIRCYGQLDEKAPPSTMMMTHEDLDEFFAHLQPKEEVLVEEPVINFSDQVKKFLKHYGVKGMKWGVRKDDSTGGGKKKSSPSKKEAKTAEANKTVHLSADAERFVSTVKKHGYEMSDREIKEVNNRLEAIKKYNQLVNDPNAEIRAKVESMRLQKDYAQLRAELNPSKLDRVNRFIKKVNEGYSSYAHINELSGGVLNKMVAEAVHMPPPTKGGAHKLGVKTKNSSVKVSSSNADLKV